MANDKPAALTNVSITRQSLARTAPAQADLINARTVQIIKNWLAEKRPAEKPPIPDLQPL